MSSKTNKTYTVLLLVIVLVLLSKICFVNGHEKHEWMRYILVWSISPTPSNSFIKNLGKGQDTFIKRQCLHQNCFITRDDTFLDNIYDFDAILFLASELSDIPLVPDVRYDDQKYVFVGQESAVTKPVKEEFNSFFNWTWTYKLESDIRSNDVVIRNKMNEIIGPEHDMDWVEYNNLKPISLYMRNKLESKKVAAIWFASRCNTSSKREDFISQLQKELLFEYKLDLRKCGECGEYKCLIENNDYCLSKVESDYYFYLAFENALCEDFVTERVVNALQHYAIPIVYGGANYSRFLPAGSYLNANELSPNELAKKIHSIINDKEEYYKFFRWHKYYSYHHIHESPETDDYCAFCALLNDYIQMNERSAYTHFVRWWNEPSDWPAEWSDGRTLPQLTTRYESPNNTLNQKVKVLVQNPKSLLLPPDEHIAEDDFITRVGKFFRRFFK